ncbi:MAG: hypothetical protein R3272_10180 [Candidatus Promineifilaceae bacterium]|nr:hypothetical protein [Candidatus Promineifilaceae bacterium]
MFRYLQRKTEPHKLAPDTEEYSFRQLLGDATLPISMKTIVGLPHETRERFLRILLPHSLLALLEIKPVSWKGPEGDGHIALKMSAVAGLLNVQVRRSAADPDPVLTLELQDNRLNGVDLNLIVLSDPDAPRFAIDADAAGQPTLFGTLRRNLQAEEAAMAAGLAPGQVRAGLRGSRAVFDHLDTFLAVLAHYSLFLEPLTYASAWVFERRGFAYVRGHRLMDDINREFQPGGRLHTALDGSTPFRQPDQWRTVRGRAWAIHDGILEAIEAEWDGLRMVKQIGQHAEVETFPDAKY